MPVVKNIESIKRITVLYVAPNELPKELIMPPTVRTLKEIINGPIKTIYLQTDVRDKPVILCNANKDRSLTTANRYLPPYGIIYGNFIIVRETSNGDYKSLTKEQISTYQSMFNNESISQVNEQIKNLIALRRKIRRM